MKTKTKMTLDDVRILYNTRPDPKATKEAKMFDLVELAWKIAHADDIDSQDLESAYDSLIVWIADRAELNRLDAEPDRDDSPLDFDDVEE